MRVLIVLALGLTHLQVAGAVEPERVSLSRYFTLKTCYKAASCIGPVAKGIDRANIQMELAPFRKNSLKGVHAWDRARVQSDGIQFRSEIHVVKNDKPGPYKYVVYIMLRSGRREGKMTKLYLNDLSELNQKVISDEPISFEGGSLQAQLVVGPKLPLDKD